VRKRKGPESVSPRCSFCRGGKLLVSVSGYLMIVSKVETSWNFSWPLPVN
jgi:hypothetical protein